MSILAVYDAWMRLEGVYECLGLVGQMLYIGKALKGKIPLTCTFETSKYQSRPI